MNAPQPIILPGIANLLPGTFIDGQGGFLAGVFNLNDQRYALIVAPRSEGDTAGCWNSNYDRIEAAQSCNDGAANTAAMATAGSELAKWAGSLQINGHADWYLPSRDELELLYRNLKPTTQQNCCSFRDGDNPSSVPAGYLYSATSPAQTCSTAFQAGGEEAFLPEWYWSSTQYQGDRNDAWCQTFYNGIQDDDGKDNERRARAVRRIQLQ